MTGLSFVILLENKYQVKVKKESPHKHNEYFRYMQARYKAHIYT